MTLIERLEAASGPDRELDEAIWLATKCHIEPQRSYTASIDAALTLVPGSNEHTALFWQLGNDGAGGNPADFLARLLICTNLTSREFRAVAATPALALCIAALRARETDRG